MRIAIDTNRYSDLARGDKAVQTAVQNAEEVFVPFPVLAELRIGFLGGSKGADNERQLREFLRRAGVSVLFADEPTTRHFASLMLQLRRQGTPLPINDVWIAALTLQHGLTLYARDKHFDHIPQLMRL